MTVQCTPLYGLWILTIIFHDYVKLCYSEGTCLLKTLDDVQAKRVRSFLWVKYKLLQRYLIIDTTHRLSHVLSRLRLHNTPLLCSNLNMTFMLINTF